MSVLEGHLTAVSQDGTSIDWATSGSGPALVLVHGSVSDRGRWTSVLKPLEKYFTVHAVDRRGRGRSGDGPAYALEREAQDIAAVVDALPGPVNLLGQDFGSLCCLEAARLTSNLRKVVLYEGIPAGPVLEPDHPGLLGRLEALGAAGRNEELVLALMQELFRVPPDRARQAITPEGWARLVAGAATIPRELRASEEYEFLAQRFAGVQVPVLLLAGSESPDRARSAAEATAAQLPRGRYEEVPGRFGLNRGEAEFLAAVLKFLGMRRIALRFPSLQAPLSTVSRRWFDLA